MASRSSHQWSDWVSFALTDWSHWASHILTCILRNSWECHILCPAPSEASDWWLTRKQPSYSLCAGRDNLQVIFNNLQPLVGAIPMVNYGWVNLLKRTQSVIHWACMETQVVTEGHEWPWISAFSLSSCELTCRCSSLTRQIVHVAAAQMISAFNLSEL